MSAAQDLAEALRVVLMRLDLIPAFADPDGQTRAAANRAREALRQWDAATRATTESQR